MESIANAINTLLSKTNCKESHPCRLFYGGQTGIVHGIKKQSEGVCCSDNFRQPGVERQSDRRVRAIQDSALAVILQEAGCRVFVDDGIRNPCGKVCESHPQFVSLKASRTQHVDVKSLAKILCSMSLGRQPSLWKDLADPPVPLLLLQVKMMRNSWDLLIKCNTIDSQKLRKSATLEEVCSECACLRLEQQPNTTR
ncbi:hypothetical protein KP509_1Z300900 [Ceratopteris richardii]|nr:hypothetical protein KP509_1Z300900 [Ceratopteris richardii]